MAWVASFLNSPGIVHQAGRNTRLSLRASTHDQAGTSGRDHYTYNAGSASERQKATIEHVFGSAAEKPGSSGSEAPWHLGWQVNERNLIWNNDLKLRLLQRHIAQELGITQHEAQQRIMDITSLLPGLAPRLAAIKASTVVLLCADIEARSSAAACHVHACANTLPNSEEHACRRSRPGSSS
jgi:hypothetical protein